MHLKNAFTLAEVLITLGIIGIVAAMTMPALIAKWQEKAIDSQFKRTYSNMYNAMRMIVAQQGTIPQCYYSQSISHEDERSWAQCAEFYDALKSHLKVVKVCNGNAYRDGCIPKYNGVDTIKKYEGTGMPNGCSGFRQNVILNTSYSFIMNDGSILFTYQGPSTNWLYSGVFAIDLNGKKGPNKWGYDIFSFAFEETNNYVKMTPGNCQLVEDGGRHAKDLLLNVK